MAAQATATGSLGGTPVANLLIYVLDRRLTGTLVIEDPGGRKSAVLFRTGVPAKVKLPEPAALLSDVLVDTSAIDRETAEETYQGARATQQLHGATLREQGKVDADTLAEALGEQVARKVEWLCTLPPESVFGYYEGQDYLVGYGGEDLPTLEPLQIVWRALRLQATDAAMSATLAILGDREMRLHPNSRVGRFGFDARERGVLDVLRAKPQPLPALLASGMIPEAQLRKVLYTLAVTRHLDLGSGGGPVGVPGVASHLPPAGPLRSSDRSPDALPTGNHAGRSSPAPRAASAAPPDAVPTAPPAAVSAEAAAFIDEVRTRCLRIGAQNYYEILGVERKAGTAAIQAAFFQLAKKWHPDRLGPELASVRDDAVRIFARMSEANQVLTNDDQRKEYERLIKEGGSTADEQEVVQKVLRAASAFQKAEVLVRRGNIDEALRHVEIAVENDGEQAEYVALYADLLSQQPDRARNGNYADVVKLVNEAKKKQPQNLKVRLYRARVLKRSGDGDTAYREFRAIVEQDAANVEAAREVRLHQMRRGKASTTDPRKRSDGNQTEPPKDPGLFGKFFKR